MNLFDVLNGMRKFRCNSKFYKYDTLEDINKIPIPTQKFDMDCDMTESVEYILQRKATEHKRAGNLELAIACLKKSNDIMPYSPIMYGKDEYLRLPRYLRKAGRFNEAKAEELKILGHVSKQHCNTTKNIIEKTKSMSRKFCDLPLIVVARETLLCSECAKYHDRIYSLNQNDKRFLPFNIFEEYMKSKPCSCHLITFPFTWEISTMTGKGENDPIGYSNRPFVDDRTRQEKENYDEYISKQKENEKDRKDYDWICEYLPNISPKSFGGYKKMKNSNSQNYKKIIDEAREKNYYI